MDDIEIIVDEYNQAAEQQRVRLQKLFDLLEIRKGTRRVIFGCEYEWQDCWDLPFRETAYANYVDRIILPITKVYRGEE